MVNTPSYNKQIVLVEFIAKRPLTYKEKIAFKMLDAGTLSIAHLNEIAIKNLLHNNPFGAIIKTMVEHQERVKKHFNNTTPLGIGGPMGLRIETENLILSGVDEVSRRIFFGRYLSSASVEDGNDVDQISIEYAIRAIHKMIDSNPKKPIEIHMNSYGGDPYSMIYLHDLILSSPCQFKFFGGGAIMSAATWILAVCDERYLYKNTRVMVHAGSLSIDSTFADAEIRMAEEKRLQDELETIYANNSRMPKKFWTEVCKRDLYLSADEAVILGLADKVIDPKKRGSLRSLRQTALSQKIPTGTMKKLVSRLFDRVLYPDLKELTINEPKLEEIDKTLTIDNTKDVPDDQPPSSQYFESKPK